MSSAAELTHALSSPAVTAIQRDEPADKASVTGLRFHIIFASLVLACLLVALNGSMLGTVS